MRTSFLGIVHGKRALRRGLIGALALGAVITGSAYLGSGQLGSAYALGCTAPPESYVSDQASIENPDWQQTDPQEARAEACAEVRLATASDAIDPSADIAATRFAGNWAGYVATKPGTAFDDIKGAWQQPIGGGCAKGTQGSTFWVGLDGSGSNTVEQIGTALYCVNSTAVNFAWYELYPQSLTAVPTSVINIRKGDIVSAEVAYATSSTSYTMTLRDLTTGQSYQTVSQTPGATRSSAEWIAEAPTNGSDVRPLTNFGNVVFINASATAGGHTGSITDPAWSSDRVVKVTGGDISAVPSSLTTDGSAFVVNWVAP